MVLFSKLEHTHIHQLDVRVEQKWCYEINCQTSLLKLYVVVEKCCSDKNNFFVIQAKPNSWQSPDITHKRVLAMKIKNQVNGKENWFAIWVRGRYNEAEVLSCQGTTWQSNSSVSVFSHWSESATITTTKTNSKFAPSPIVTKYCAKNIEQFHQHH